MTLRTALKKKARLAGQLATWHNKFVMSTMGHAIRRGEQFTLEECKTQIMKLSAELVEIKALIHKANGPVYDKIFELAEQKNLLKSVSRLDTSPKVRNIVTTDSAGNKIRDIEEVSPELSEKEKQAWLDEIQGRIETLQDELDQFNAITIV